MHTHEEKLDGRHLIHHRLVRTASSSIKFAKMSKGRHLFVEQRSKLSMMIYRVHIVNVMSQWSYKSLWLPKNLNVLSDCYPFLVDTGDNKMSGLSGKSRKCETQRKIRIIPLPHWLTHRRCGLSNNSGQYCENVARILFLLGNLSKVPPEPDWPISRFYYFGPRDSEEGRSNFFAIIYHRTHNVLSSSLSWLEIII